MYGNAVNIFELLLRANSLVRNDLEIFFSNDLRHPSNNNARAIGVEEEHKVTKRKILNFM